LYSINGELLECKFDHGSVVGSGKGDGFGKNSGKIKILFTDGSFYEGMWIDNKRNGSGI
jgi:hypothetical protein